MEKIRVGYCGPDAKWQRMNWDSIVRYAAERNVELVHIDLHKPIELQGNFHLIIHKMTYIMKGHDFEFDPELKELYQFSVNHPEIKIVDGLNEIAVTLDREELNNALSSISWPQELKVSTPQAKMLLSTDEQTINEAVKGLRFPVLSKPKGASSTRENHTLRLASNPNQLIGAPAPSLLQEYVNHGGVVYKIYALGDHIEVDLRPSTRDVEPNECINLDFHSQYSDSNDLWTKKRDLSNIPVPLEDFMKMSKIIRKDLKMELIGFDILIDKDNHYWIVDLNYFPGFHNVENIEQKFLDFFLSEIGETPR